MYFRKEVVILDYVSHNDPTGVTTPSYMSKSSFLEPDKRSENFKNTKIHEFFFGLS